MRSQECGGPVLFFFSFFGGGVRWVGLRGRETDLFFVFNILCGTVFLVGSMF